MRLSELFGRTLRQAAGVEGPASGLSERSALVRFHGASVAALPLGARVMEKILSGVLSSSPTAQRLRLPPGPSDSCWAELLRAEIQSYRQLPCLLFSERALSNPEPGLKMIQPAWRQGMQWVWVEPSLEGGREALDKWKEAVAARLENWGLHLSVVERSADHEGWFFDHEEGLESVFHCAACGYAAQSDAAQFQRSASGDSGDLEELERVRTPDADSIAALAAYLDIPTSETLKAVFLKAEEQGLVFALLRGDLEISLPKLQSLLQVEGLEAAREQDIRAAGAEPGYAGPIGLPVRDEITGAGVLVIGDLSLEGSTNLVTGANEPDFHLKGVNYPRDFNVTMLADIARAREGASCPNCGEPLGQRDGFTLGSWGVHEAGVSYTSADGEEAQAAVLLATLWVDPLFTALIEVNCDEQGIAWPPELAPFHVHLLEIKRPNEGEALYHNLRDEGLEVLYDDREQSTGVKFTDADLIGCPLRVIVGRRSLEQGGAEVSFRGGEQPRVVALEEVPESVRALLENIM